MRHSKFLSLLCTLAFLVLDAECLPRLCGHELINALDAACTNGFNTKLKRAFLPHSELNDNDVDQSGLVIFDDYTEPGSLLARILLSESAGQLVKTRRRRYGINDECCRKSCTYDELYAYCRVS